MSWIFFIFPHKLLSFQKIFSENFNISTNKRSCVKAATGTMLSLVKDGIILDLAIVQEN